MIEIVWDVLVKPDFRGQFELVYGPGGAWSKVFGKSPGYRGTTVLNDTENAQRYLIIDHWDSDDELAQALRDCAEDYARLTADLTDWIEARTQIGAFRIRAEATVRPRGKASRRSRR